MTWSREKHKINKAKSIQQEKSLTSIDMGYNRNWRLKVELAEQSVLTFRDLQHQQMLLSTEVLNSITVNSTSVNPNKLGD